MLSQDSSRSVRIAGIGLCSVLIGIASPRDAHALTHQPYCSSSKGQSNPVTCTGGAPILQGSGSLLTHPEIADAAVVAALDEEAGEIPKAFVVLKDGSQLDAEAVMQFVGSQVAPHKKVRAVSFIDAVPKSSAGKILRKDLKGK